MAIVVKKPSDDPYTWLGPEFTIHHFQEDALATGELKNHGLFEDGNIGFGATLSGNGYYNIQKQGANGPRHDLLYIYKDLTQASTFVCSFNMTGPARSNQYTGVDNSTFFGIVMKNTSTGKLVTWGVEFNAVYGPVTVIRQYANESVVKGTTLAIYGYPRIDIADTLILKVVRDSSTQTDFYLSTDGVSFMFIYQYDSAAGVGGGGPNPTPDTNRIGVGLDVIENGTTISHYAVPYSIAIDWVAYT